MADNAPGENSPFDIIKIRQLVKLMRENELSEVDLRFENARIRLRRGPEGIVTTSGGFAPPIVVPASNPAPATGSTEPAASSPAASVNEQTINSPIVGTFYSASSPDAEPFTAVGNKVNAKTVVCIVEAMKVFNEIQAGISGTIVACLVENGSPVEYGQPLFRVRPD